MGCNSYQVCRNKVRIGGGISIYIGTHLTSVSWHDISFVSRVIENCSAKVTCGNDSIFVKEILLESKSTSSTKYLFTISIVTISLHTTPLSDTSRY